MFKENTYLALTSSANAALVFAIVVWGETNRSSLSQMFFKIDFLKKFANFTGKHLCWNLSSIKFQVQLY